jgi:mRNA interferase HigB
LVWAVFSARDRTKHGGDYQPVVAVTDRPQRTPALRRAVSALLPVWEHGRFCALRIFSRNTLVEFWTKHPDAEGPLRLWFSMVEKAAWTAPADVRTTFGSADFLTDNRVVFDVKGNSYRLVVRVKYAPLFLVFVRFLGTHAEYDRIDAKKV